MSEQQHEEAHLVADGILDWLILSFHANPGDSHLEGFSQADLLDQGTGLCWFTFNKPFLPTVLLPKEHESDLLAAIPADHVDIPKYRERFSANIPLRAPPHHI
ncbi:MAG: hypothetical protein KDC34_14765 [Saprospiraceae bacterium]|nr:hypothetical protein [Saprospiraceae bacterium]